MQVVVGSPVLRVTAVLLAAVVGVHQLRYLLAFGSDASAVLGHTGHGYMSFAVPLIGISTAVALAQLVVRAARGAASRRALMRRAWLVAGVALLVLYGSQELLEGALSSDHPGGLAGVFGNGGWLAIPLSLAFGALVTLVLRVARAVERAGAGIRLALPRLRAPRQHSTAAATGQLRTRRRSGRRAGRAPPQLSI